MNIGKYGYFPLNLTQESEERARHIHEKSIIIDALYQGPLSPYSLSKESEEVVLKAAEPYYDETDKVKMKMYMFREQRTMVQMAIDGILPEFRDCWYDSGITAGNRQLGIEELLGSMATVGVVQQQFDRFPWLIKALTAKDIERAKKEDKKAGFISIQETVGLGQSLELLETFHMFGLRMVQLTYNTHNFVGAGCMERNDAGVSNFGKRFIERLNDLNILVDTGHSGKQTTLDACKLSRAPVVASHTCVESIHAHRRAKSDDEIRAIADSGGVIGIVAVPHFLRADFENASVNDVVDQMDYIIDLVGEDHVGIGTDWPMTNTLKFMLLLKNHYAPSLEFSSDEVPSTEVIEGFTEYRQMINFTRAMVARGYSDTRIEKILGGNWMRVFGEVWK